MVGEELGLPVAVALEDSVHELVEVVEVREEVGVSELEKAGVEVGVGELEQAGGQK